MYIYTVNADTNLKVLSHTPLFGEFTSINFNRNPCSLEFLVRTKNFLSQILHQGSSCLCEFAMLINRKLLFGHKISHIFFEYDCTFKVFPKLLNISCLFFFRYSLLNTG